LDQDVIFSRKQGRFPELKELKQLMRDRIAPDKDLDTATGNERPVLTHDIAELQS
jgi:predicted Rdx family selenoprotein